MPARAKKTPVRHPAWSGGPARTGRDWSTRVGAAELAAIVQHVWREQCGVTPKAEMVKIARGNGMSDVYCVKFPDIVNGLYKPEASK
jgi:hypothetical protein